MLINGETSLRGTNGRYLDMTVTVRPGNKNSMYKWFRLYVARDGEYFSFIRYRPETVTIEMTDNYDIGDAVHFIFDGKVTHVFSKETDKNLEF